MIDTFDIILLDDLKKVDTCISSQNVWVGTYEKGHTIQTRSHEVLRTGEVSTTFWKFWKSKFNVRTKVRFLVNTPVYNFKIKRIPSSLNIFNRKNKRCPIYLPIPYNRPSLSRGHQTITIMNYCCYCFNGLWKVKAKYIVLCLNAFAKLQNAKREFRHLVLMGNCPTCSLMPWPYQSTGWFVISPF